MLKIQYQTFGIITKLMVLRANGEEQRIVLHNFFDKGRAVLAQKKANVRSCVRKRKNDDNRYVEFKIAQKVSTKE